MWFNEFKPVLLGQEIYFGEISGKHSEIYGDLTESDFIENDDETIKNDFYNKHSLYNNPQHSFIKTFHYQLNESSEDTNIHIIKKLLNLLEQ